jgi:hypothetical protein
VQLVRVTHPFHPLRGREYELFRTRIAWGEERVYVKDEQGHVRSFPSSWTDVGPKDPFVEIAVGRCALRLLDLLQMVDLLSRGQR